MCNMLFYAFVLVSLATLTAISTEARSSFLNCSDEQWQCEDGTCISSSAKCDSVVDCPDRSDESWAYCSRHRRQTDVCVLPSFPHHGTYSVANVPNAQPGQSAGSFVLTVSCMRGYGIVNPNGGSENSTQLYCIAGEWYQAMPKCVRFCRLNPNPSVRYMCHVPGVGYKTCDSYVPPGTSVNPICNAPNYYSPDSLLYMNCISGLWNYVAQCKPECGRVTPSGEQLLLHGTPAKRGELPWHVGIYWKLADPYKQICGGSIISNNVVISAAHCFWSDVKQQLPASDYLVAAGKLYRMWDSEDDVGVQKSEVKEIKLPVLFQGETANFQEDIAMVLLTTRLVYKTYIRPVCLNFDTKFDKWQLQDGKLGKVAGWGLTAIDGFPSKILKVIDMPFITAVNCINNSPTSFREYITGDKFCAGYNNGTALCRGDSGGGLAFPNAELSIDRYYLRGIVSAAPKREDKKCNDLAYTAFTKITKHEDFIKETLAAGAEKVCASNMLPCADGTACVEDGMQCDGKRDCSDGSDESEDLCPAAVITSTTTPKPTASCVLPPFPADGSYVVPGFSSLGPGDSVPFGSITVSCEAGYGLANRDEGIDDSDNLQIFCNDGKWTQEIPDCVRFCELPQEVSLRYACPIRGTRKYKICKKYIPPDTVVKPICNTPNFYHKGALRLMVCTSGGIWDHIPRCKAECGLTTPQAELLAHGGSPARRGEMPWLIAIYEKNATSYRQICSGNIISTTKVITAAHCFWNNVAKLKPASNYAVAAGKLYREWDSPEDVDAQKSEIKEIHIPKQFQGSASNFQADIAILEVATPFVYKPYVRPVCVDFDFNFERQQLVNGKLGKISGWGLTEANGSVSSILRVVQLPYKSTEDCVNIFPPSFREFFTLDKFCAGYANGTAALCSGDTGGGLVFPDSSTDNVKRYYLRGIASTAPFNEDLCNIFTPIAMTKVSSHENFLKQYF